MGSLLWSSGIQVWSYSGKFTSVVGIGDIRNKSLVLQDLDMFIIKEKEHLFLRKAQRMHSWQYTNYCTISNLVLKRSELYPALSGSLHRHRPYESAGMGGAIWPSYSKSNRQTSVHQMDVWSGKNILSKSKILPSSVIILSSFVLSNNTFSSLDKFYCEPFKIMYSWKIHCLTPFLIWFYRPTTWPYLQIMYKLP